MKILLFIFILHFLKNFVNCELTILNTVPNYLLNDGQDLIINSLDASNDINDMKVFILTGGTNPTWEDLAFEMPSTNQFLIKNDTIYKYWGERLFRLLQVSTNTYSNNYAKIGFARPIIDSVTMDITNINVTAIAWYLNNTDYPTYLRGMVKTPIAPIGFGDPITTNSGYKIFYGVVPFVRGYPYLQCNNSVSSEFTSFPLSTPDLNSLTFSKIQRKGGLIYISGRFLEVYNEKNQQILNFDFLWSGNSNLYQIPCENITTLNYYGNQVWDISCAINEYKEPTPDAFRTSSSFPSSFSQTKNYIDFYFPPSISSITPTFLGTPDYVTIKGESFCFTPNVTIGGSVCEISQSDYENGLIVCKFNSDVGDMFSTLSVYIECFKQNTTTDIFMYAIDECELSKQFNGNVCSGNGTCISDIRKCNCNTGYYNFDCSGKNGGSVNPPIIDDTGTTIIETGDSKFDIGLVQIREININNEAIKVYNLTEAKWLLEKNISTETNQVFNTTLENDSNILTILTINSDKISKNYNFYGDNITLLPNSVKYQIEIRNWKFVTKLNSLQLIFQSQISTEQCSSEQLTGKQNILMYGESIRSVELTLVNGQTLVGTFSNRMKVDDRIIKSEIRILNDTYGIPSISKNESTNDSKDKTKSIQNIYTAVSITNFNEIVIIDPNFGLLVESDVSKIGECGKEKFASWKIALIVVFSFVGVSLIIVGIAIYRGRNRHILMVNGKKVNLKEMNSNNNKVN